MAVQMISVGALDPNSVLQGLSRSLAAVVRSGDVITGTPYGEYARWLYVDVSGNVNYTKWDGTTQQLSNLASGVWHPICSIMVITSGTTATGIHWGS